jgi:serine/threonine protein kinase
VIGTTIGNYQVEQLIGEGGNGKVYLAFHPGIGRQAAVKVLATIGTSDPEMVSRFATEALAAGGIDHPNIVEVYDSGNLHGGTPYIIMEYLDGEPLTRALSRGPASLRDAVDWAGQLAEALAAAHEHQIVHRDLKPDNLFLVADSSKPSRKLVKVLDFGVAKLQCPPREQVHRTRTGALLGTPLYMSPEQCMGLKHIDARTDVYSFGVILYEMVTGVLPFDSDSVWDVLGMHINEQPIPPGTYRSNLPTQLEAIILQALAKEPSQRQQTMAEVLAQLAAMRDGTDLGFHLTASAEMDGTNQSLACRRFDETDILRFLTEIDEMLDMPLGMEIVGGAAALLAYGAKSATRDINSFSAFDQRIQQLALRTKDRIPLTRAPKSPLLGFYDDRRIRAHLPQLRKLVIWVPDRYDLLFMKLVRASSHDVQVLEEMHASRPFDIDEIIERFNDSSQMDRIGRQLQVVMHRLFGDAAKGLRSHGWLSRRPSWQPNP